MADMMRLRRKFPQLRNFAELADESREGLQPHYEEYISGISVPQWAISLELSAFLMVLCNISKPKRILDLGSGFSSFVFRSYILRRSCKPTVWSVDDCPEWLDKTRAFLAAHNLSVENLSTWATFVEQKHDTFDFILHDLGCLELRKQTLSTVLVLAHPSGIVILDDIHKKRYEPYVKQVLRKSSLKYYSLKLYTTDRFGRYSMLVTH